MRAIRWLALILGCALLLWQAQAEDALPAKPTRYVSDRAFLLDQSQQDTINAQLEAFEKETSNQIVVAIFGKLPENEEVAHYSTEVFHAWGIGQKDRDNGVVLFVFKDDHKLFIATGRGMEGALPDVTCQQIIANEIVPRFRQNDYPGGIQAGVNAILAATKGEYHGTGKTVADRDGNQKASAGPGLIFLIILIIFFILKFRGGGGAGMLLGGGGFSSFGGGFSGGGGGFGGGGGGGGGGGFSGGGGDSGGGGAGGSW